MFFVKDEPHLRQQVFEEQTGAQRETGARVVAFRVREVGDTEPAGSPEAPFPTWGGGPECTASREVKSAEPLSSTQWPRGSPGGDAAGRVQTRHQ